MLKIGPGRWTVVHEPRPNAPKQLLCFHHAGGGANSFRDWPTNLGADVEVVAVQLPGRENRFSEAPLTDAEAIVDGLSAHLAGVLRPGYAIFGHSLGASLGYLFARRAEESGDLPAPAHLVVSAAAPPLARRGAAEASSREDPSVEELVAQLGRYGGTPAALLDNAAHLNLFVQILRNDLRVFASIPRQGNPPIGAPITVVYGTEDEACQDCDMTAWGRLSRQGADVQALPGGHFYFLNLQRRFYDILGRCLRDGGCEVAGRPGV
jgi:surfactin synthase thioesterase subunit